MALNVNADLALTWGSVGNLACGSPEGNTKREH